ncbi:hypothetical protein PLICRDRAFT_104776 [Plicaturopsis crispa FD-325 SS-3]|nr:hypothetical protein PLICRDRAFT_104776 [Plicaturopsis crispa FD-325 SS-3]
MSATEAPSTAPTSESSTQDITFCSEDGLFFQVHRTNLDMHADRFPDADSTTSSPTNPIKLPESGDVLDLLFQYMYRQRQPDLATVPFKVLCGLAHAVEKYRVFPALEICKIHMRDAIPAHPLPVLVYAARYGHITLMDAAARESIGLPLEEVYATLGNDSKVLLAWVNYLLPLTIHN